MSIGDLSAAKIAEEIITLSKDPLSTLPSSFSDSDLVAAGATTIPNSASFLSALLSLLSRSPRPSLLRSLTPSLPTLLLPSISVPDSPHPLDLLPRVLDLASADACADPIIEGFLEAHWPKHLLLKLASILRDFPASIPLSGFLHKILTEMKGIDLQDLPSLVYQLLVVASKGPDRRSVVRGLLGFFGNLVRGPGAVVRQVEGTVLMHLNFAVKQDPELGQEIVAFVRSDLRSINHFVVAVLFSVARVRRFNESSIGALRLAVLGSRSDFRAARDCKWLADCLKEECLEIALFVEKAFMKAIKESNCGREHVVPSIVQFGFVLLESVESENEEDGGCSGGLMSIEELGISTLKTLFEVHDMARNEIIERCKFRILSLKVQQSAAVIRLLGDLVQSYPFSVLEHVEKVKELLDYFIFMHENAARCLVNAVLPLIRFSRDLQDYIILVVRKAMFRREDAVRLAATSAIIDLILAENRLKRNNTSSLQDSSSQASCSQQADLHCKNKEGLFQELSGLLRRCLSQQAGVKEIVYQGLVKLVLLDPSVSSCVFDFLWPHFLQFYKEDATTSLRLDNCSKLDSGKFSLIEPLDCLLSCVSWILLLQQHGKPDRPSDVSLPCFGFSLSQENEAGTSTSGELFSNALMKIRTTLSPYRLGEDQESGSHSSNGEKTCRDGWLLAGIIEVIVNIIISELEKASEEQKITLEKEILELIDVHDSLEKPSSTNKQGTLLRKGARVSVQDIPDKTDNASKEGPRPSAPKLFQMRRHFLVNSSIYQLLGISAKLYSAGNYNNQAVSQSNSQSSWKKAFDRCLKLASFALKACLHQIKFINSVGRRHSGDSFETLIYGDFKQLGRPLMQLAWLLKSSPKLQSGAKKGKKVGEAKGDQLHLSLLCLNELFKLNSSRDSFNELVEDLVSVAASEFELECEMGDVQGSIHEQDLMDDRHVKCINLLLEKRIKPLYLVLLSASFYRETEVLSELFLTICKKLPDKIRVSHGYWVVKICRNSMIESPNAARSVLDLAIRLVSSPYDLIFAHEIASELLKVNGAEDKEPIELSEAFAIVNHSTKTAIASVLFQLVEQSLSDLAWSTSKLKSYTISYQEARVSVERSNGLVLEESLYSRTEALVNLLCSFAEMNLNDSQSDQLLRITTKFYKLLARMTKLCIAPKGSKQLLPSQKFQKLAETTCRKLTSPLYNFVALVQRNQQDNIQRKGIIGKIKRESKCIPELIFQIEDYERYLIQLSKLTKVNLLRHAKRSTARDFKILEAKKPESDEPCSSPSEGEGEGEGEGENELVKDACMESCDEESTGEEVGEEMVVKRKKAKLNKVVQDSDEET